MTLLSEYYCIRDRECACPLDNDRGRRVRLAASIGNAWGVACNDGRQHPAAHHGDQFRHNLRNRRLWPRPADRRAASRGGGLAEDAGSGLGEPGRIAAPASKWKAAGRKRGDLLQFSGRPTASVRRSGQGQTPRAPLREPGSAFLVLLRSWMLGVEQVRIDENRRSGEPSPCSMSSATLSGESPGLRSPRSRAVILKACGWAVTRRLASPRRGISLTISRRGWSARRASALSLVATSSSRVSVVLAP
jgi:hypothetical protein